MANHQTPEELSKEIGIDRGPFRLGLSYVDTDVELPNTDATVVASVSVGF